MSRVELGTVGEGRLRCAPRRKCAGGRAPCRTDRGPGAPCRGRGLVLHNPYCVCTRGGAPCSSSRGAPWGSPLGATPSRGRGWLRKLAYRYHLRDSLECCFSPLGEGPRTLGAPIESLRSQGLLVLSGPGLWGQHGSGKLSPLLFAEMGSSGHLVERKKNFASYFPSGVVVVVDLKGLPAFVSQQLQGGESQKGSFQTTRHWSL